METKGEDRVVLDLLHLQDAPRSRSEAEYGVRAEVTGRVRRRRIFHGEDPAHITQEEAHQVHHVCPAIEHSSRVVGRGLSDVAKSPCDDLVSEPTEQRIEASRVVDHEQCAACRASLDHRTPIVEGLGDRLLADHGANATARADFDAGPVLPGRGRDRYDLGMDSVEHRLDAGEPTDSGKKTRRVGDALSVHVHDGDQLGSGARAVGAGVGGGQQAARILFHRDAHAPAADDCRSVARAGHGRSRVPRWRAAA